MAGCAIFGVFAPVRCGVPFLGYLHPAGAQNKTLISNTDRIPRDFVNLNNGTAVELLSPVSYFESKLISEVSSRVLWHLIGQTSIASTATTFCDWE